MKTLIGEFFSLLSCLLNLLVGGQREITFSADSWALQEFGTTERQRAWGRKRVKFVDWLNKTLTGEIDHCHNAWLKHLEFWKIRIALEESRK